MNILFLALDVDLSRNRGDSVHVRELSSQLQKSGNRVRLVTGSSGAVDSTVGDHSLRAESTLRQVLQAVRLARGWADIVYERRLSPKVSWAVSALTGIPFVVEVNGVLEDELEALSRPSGGVARRLKSRMRGYLFQRATKIVAVSRGIRDGLTASYNLSPDQVVIIPNGANLGLFLPRDRKACRSELGVSQDAFVVCFVGNMVPWQGISTLLAATKSLKGSLASLKVLLAGDGPDLHAFEEEARRLGVEDSSTFLGAVPYQDVPMVIGAADVCVAPFEKTRKASPIKVFEYLACARAAVCSDIDEIGEFLTSSNSGVLFKAGDSAALASSIQWVRLHPEEADQMGRRGRDAVEQAGSWHATARQVLRVLEECRTRREPARRGA